MPRDMRPMFRCTRLSQEISRPWTRKHWTLNFVGLGLALILNLRNLDSEADARSESENANCHGSFRNVARSVLLSLKWIQLSAPQKLKIHTIKFTVKSWRNWSRWRGSSLSHCWVNVFAKLPVARRRQTCAFEKLEVLSRYILLFSAASALWTSTEAGSCWRLVWKLQNKFYGSLHTFLHNRTNTSS